jgi:DNA ligase-1
LTVSDILNVIKDSQGSNAKKAVLENHRENDLLKKVLKYGLDPFTPFNIVKVPKVKSGIRLTGINEECRWSAFFETADACSKRDISGNEAVNEMYSVFECATPDEEKWMRKILKKHLAIGASTKTVNKVFPGLIPTFDVALAQKFEEKRIVGKSVCVEPKLDGIRCFAIIENGIANLYARSGKQIKNFDDTIGADLARLPDGCYDGEIMGEDFVSLMRQAYRKDNVITEGTYLAIFDYLPMKEWKSRKSEMRCEERYIHLLHSVCGSHPKSMNNNLARTNAFKHLCVVNRVYVKSDYNMIKGLHDEFVTQGYEGAMVKDLDAPYKFGRGPEVMKLKAFHDVDLEVAGLQEGTGKHSGKLGSVLVSYNGVDVQVGSGFSDELREIIWEKPDDFIGRTIEVRYQEETPDGSLRFPTFVCFRNDRD